MTGKQIKVIAISASGQIIEFYDFMIFALLANVISAHFFAGTIYTRYMYLFGVFALGNFARPIGGIISGHFGDTIGRKKTFFFTLLLISIATFCMGLIPGYKTIGIAAPIIFILLRIIQGISLGGELPGGISFVYEYMPENKRTFGTALLSSGVTVGMLLASCSATIIYLIFSNSQILSFGWRIPFFFGGVLGFIICIFRSRMSDTPVFKRLLEGRQVLKYPLKKLLKKNKVNCMLGIFIDLTAIVSIIFIVIFPSILSSLLHLYTYKTIIRVNTLSAILVIVFVVLFAYIIDKFKFNIFLCNALGCILVLGLSYPIFMLLLTQNVYCLILAYIIIALLMGAIYSSLFHVLAKLFPPTVKYSGLGLVINISVILSVSCTPLMSTYLLKSTGSLYSIAYALMIIIILPAAANLILYFFPPNEKKFKEWEDEIKELYNLDKQFRCDYLTVEEKALFTSKIETLTDKLFIDYNNVKSRNQSVQIADISIKNELNKIDIENITSLNAEQKKEFYKRCEYLLSSRATDSNAVIEKYKKLLSEAKGDKYYTYFYGRLMIKEHKAINNGKKLTVEDINCIIKTN
ncbi:MAG: MHS family MFS transporter [bacterium]|nr:MHS family MFS transporter [bacterium]